MWPLTREELPKRKGSTHKRSPLTIEITPRNFKTPLVSKELIDDPKLFFDWLVTLQLCQTIWSKNVTFESRFPESLSHHLGIEGGLAASCWISMMLCSKMHFLDTQDSIFSKEDTEHCQDTWSILLSSSNPDRNLVLHHFRQCRRAPRHKH